MGSCWEDREDLERVCRIITRADSFVEKVSIYVFGQNQVAFCFCVADGKSR